MSEEITGGVPKTQITVSGVQADLNNGLTRPQIQAKYNLTGKDLKSLFSHPKLKGLKTKPAPSFTLIDDVADVVEEVVENAEAPIVEDVVEDPTTVDADNVEVEEEF